MNKHFIHKTVLGTDKAETMKLNKQSQPMANELIHRRE